MIRIGEVEFYDVKEIAVMFNVQEATARKWLKQGRFEGRKFSNKWYVPKTELERILIPEETRAYMEKQQQPVPKEKPEDPKPKPKPKREVSQKLKDHVKRLNELNRQRHAQKKQQSP